jgi:hypothetical protein
VTAKKCLKCGKKNPHFFTHCVDCGAKLDDNVRKAGIIPTWLRTGLILGGAVLLVVFVILPLVQYSHTFGKNLSETVSANSAAESEEIAEYSLNEPVSDGDLEITVLSAHDGQNTYNSNKFFIVTVYLKNIRTSGNIQISNSDFVLIDREGTPYYPYGIGSKVMYDLSPSQGNAAELTFVIPQKALAKQIQFTFPATSALAGKRDVARFVI